MSKSDFLSKVVLVTGSSSGIGAATAIHFAKLGARVVICGRNAERVKNVAEECERRSKENGFNHDKVVLEVVGELTVDDNCRRLTQTTIDTFERLDILVNNAGILSPSPINNEALMSIYDAVIKTNLRIAVLMCHLAVPHLEKTRGAIVNVSSIGAIRPVVGFSSYCMSKAALDMFTKCLAIELGPKGIRVNAVNPGTVNTKILETLGLSPEMIDGAHKMTADLTPLRKVVEPEDVAKAIAFLSSDDSSLVTGISLIQDGGLIWTLPQTRSD